MAVEYRCPRLEQEAGTGAPDALTPFCADCDALIRVVDERGEVTYHCLLFDKELPQKDAAPRPSLPVKSRATWSREDLDLEELP